MTSKKQIYARLLGAAAVVIAIDQATKQLARSFLSDGPLHLIPSALSLNLTYNPGGAFGFMQNAPELFLVAGLVIVAIILVWAGRLDDPGLVWPLGLILGGGVGNLIDRALRDLEGQVVDFIDLHVWPVFNLADTAIVIGVILIAFSGARHTEPDKA